MPYVRLQDEDSGQPRVGGQASALVRVFVLPGGFRLLVGRDLAERDRFDHIVKRAYWFSIGVFLLLGFLTWLFVSRRVLKRIDAVAETSRRIMDGDLSGRLHVDGSGDEFDRLAESLNAMLERIEQLMRGLKEVSDNIAHDLKTPLTRLRNRLEETLRQDPDAADYREVIGASIEDSDTLIRTFEALLRIARVEAGSAGLEAVPTDLSEIVGEVGELYEPAGEEIDVAVKVSVAPGLWVIGHRELIAQAIANLVDNAFKYGKPTDESVAPVVRITLTARTGMPSSRSPTMAPACLPRIASGSCSASCGWRRAGPRRGPASASALCRPSHRCTRVNSCSAMRRRGSPSGWSCRSFRRPSPPRQRTRTWNDRDIRAREG